MHRYLTANPHTLAFCVGYCAPLMVCWDLHVLPQGVLADQAMNVVTFSVVSGAGRLSGTHSGDAASNEPAHGSSKRAYHGLVRAFIRRCHTANPRT